MEGGCGTGKTMIALTAGLRLVKDPRTKFERILVLTSVKQQLRQFESDLEIINENLPDDTAAARAVTLVGKPDLCPYSREEKAGLKKENATRECRRLRDQTSKVMGDGADGVALAEMATRFQENQSWETAGAKSPYAPSLPSRDIQYCPFYSNYKEHGDPLFTFGHAPNCILDPEEIVRQAVNKGVCPHSAMSVLCRDADVVIGNYYHAFDGNTLKITHDLIDETTLLVCDEAHMLEPRVRGILSTSIPTYMFGAAANEVGAVYNATGSSYISDDRINRAPPESIATEKLLDGGVSTEMVEDTYEVLRELEKMVNRSVQRYLNDRHPNWNKNPSELPSTVEVPLRNPTKKEKDAVTKWAERNNIPDTIWENLPRVANVVEATLSEASHDGGTNWSINDVAQLVEEWFERDHTRYFREITLRKNDDPHPSAKGWHNVYNADIEIHSVMPRPAIGGRVSDFGAAILMSATLAPIDVYKESIGLEYLSSVRGELVTDRMYSADFPKDNRLSITLDLPEFTYGNRGDITDNTATREQYAKAIISIAATTPGNVLVCMPSYREAKWAAALLNQNSQVKKKILTDESSAEQVTKQLKQDFIDGDPKVLITSLRGTLTEGVDFDGDKLLGCIVCGVPIENVDSAKSKAVRTAYQDQFGKNGFDYGLTVPAVRKTRQALGRVIRGTEDVGVRVIADGRYTPGCRNGVHQYLSEDEQAEYVHMDDLDELPGVLKGFWRKHR
jgi:DNA excision repair protein ERCC-2